jgi:hypothetical protein
VTHPERWDAAIRVDNSSDVDDPQSFIRWLAGENSVGSGTGSTARQSHPERDRGGWRRARWPRRRSVEAARLGSQAPGPRSDCFQPQTIQQKEEAPENFNRRWRKSEAVQAAGDAEDCRWPNSG